MAKRSRLARKLGNSINYYGRTALSWTGLVAPPDTNLIEANNFATKITRELTRLGHCYERKSKQSGKILRQVHFKSPIKIWPDRIEFEVDTASLPQKVTVGDLRKDEVVDSLKSALKCGVRLKETEHGVTYVVVRQGRKRTNFYYKELLPPQGYNPAETPGLIPLGITDMGEQIWRDLFAMPHLGVAGATGGGKSSAIHTIMSWLAQHCQPDHVKFIIIDMKRVDFPRYNIIPHMLFPVSIDVETTITQMQWVRDELIKRADLFNKVGAVDYEHYVKKIRQQNPGAVIKLPRVVCLLDDIIALDDIRVSDKHEYDKLMALIRIGAGQARALGIHLIVGVQRPDATVIDTTARANITSWLCFGVKTDMESRIVLDNNLATGLEVGDAIYQGRTTGSKDRNLFLRSPYLDVKKDEVDAILKQVRYDWAKEAEALQAKDEADRKRIANFTQRILEYAVFQLDGRCVFNKIWAKFKHEEITANEVRAILENLEAQGYLTPASGNNARTVVAETMEKIKADRVPEPALA